MQEVIYNTNNVLSNIPTVQESEYKPYQLVLETDPILSSRIVDFDFSDPNVEPVVIASRLIKTAKFHEVFSVAANQCGLRHKVFVGGSGDNFITFFNPEIINESNKTSVVPETDLSNMGLLLHVRRPNDITVQFQDVNGEVNIMQFDGLTARVVQQNIDRLNGIDFKTKVSKLVLERALKSRTKKVKKFVRHSVRV